MRAALVGVIIILLLILQCGASWKDTSKLDDALTDDEKDVIGGTGVDDVEISGGLKKLWNSGAALFKSKLRSACAASFAVLSLCVVISIVKGFVKASDSTLTDKVLDLTGVLSIMLTVLKGGVIFQTLSAAERLDTFSKILTPAYALAAAVAQHPSSAVGTASATLMFTNIVTSFTVRIVMPLISAYTAAASVAALSPDEILSKICGVVKWAVTACYKMILIGFTCYVTMTGIISAGADLLSVKTAKAVISGSVPVVGGIIADASDTILTGAQILKGSIGVYGFLGVCAICLAPFVSLLVYILVFKIIAALSSAFCKGAVSRTLEGIAGAYSLSLSVLGSCCAVQFISIVVTAAVTLN